MSAKLSRLYTRWRAFVRHRVVFPIFDCIDSILGILFHGPRLHGQTDRNIWYLYVEIFWAAVLSAAAAFNATLAVRLGASDRMIGWLSSIPSLLAVVLLIPAARFLESRANRTPWLWGSLLIARFGYAIVAVLPWLVPSTHRATSLVWLLIAISIPTTFFGAGFTPLLADVIPERARARVFANRSIILGATVAFLTFLAGRWLEAGNTISWATFPLNYQILYFAGFAASMISTAFLFKIRVPPSRVVERKPREKNNRLPWRQIRTIFGENRDFGIIIINTLIFDTGAWLVGPLYILFFVKELGASDGWIGLNNTLANVGAIVGYTLWQRWIQKLGHQRTLLITVPLAASYAFLVSMFPNLTAILVWGVWINLINPGISLSHVNILLKLCPEERRASYIAFYSVIMNAGAFVGPIVGVALAQVWPIRTLLLVGSGIRLCGAILFHLFKFNLQDTAA